MKKGTSILGLACLFLSSTFAQSVTGKWYDHNMENAQFELTITEDMDGLTGTYSIKDQNNINIVDAPLSKIIHKNDSLIIDLKQGNTMCAYKLKFVAATKSYDGFIFFKSIKGPSVSLRRNPKESFLPFVSNSKEPYTRQDSIRGSVTNERAWWDLTFYDLEVNVKPDQRYISGRNIVKYKVLNSQTVMQIDLQSPLELTSAIQNGRDLNVIQNGNAFYIYMEEHQEVGKIYSIEIFYEGNPRQALNPPWIGGFSWERDINGHHFVATSSQGIGASIWWPNKDHLYDEVDSMRIAITNPIGYSSVSNGRLMNVTENLDSTVTTVWFVDNPINNYAVNLNIGNYAHFSEIYEGEDGPLTLDYYVLKHNLEKAKEHFVDASRMMQAFEYWFGPYPFYKDGYKLVEVPYLGMEHQSSVTYGNDFKKGYKGIDLSRTGWGLTFDYLIVHESGHEWFGNNITCRDIADLWIHESFISYSESLFLNFHYGKNAASEYIRGTRKGILNDRPIIGDYDVNREGSSDMYPKGANMLHTLRQIVDNDEKWRQMLRDMNRTFHHQTVTGKQIETYICQYLEIDLDLFFDQYLRTIQIPMLEYFIDDGKMIYRWTNVIQGFDMPLRVFINNVERWIYPRTNWTHHYLELDVDKIVIDPNFYIGSFCHSENIQTTDKD